MKKTLLFLSFISILIFLVSCKENDVDYVIYADAVYADEINSMLLDNEKNIEIKSSREKNFMLDSRDKKEKDETVQSSYTVKLNGKEYVLDYANTYESAAAIRKK